MRLSILVAAVFALLLAGAAVAQIQQIRPQVLRPLIQPQSTVQAVPASQLNYQDPEMMKAQIARLKKDKRELRLQLNASVADLQAARKTLDEMTRAGGSLVTAQCASPALSRNSAGAEENCAASGYGCEPVSGLCRRMCSTSDQCASGFLCDTGAQRCVPYPSATDDE